MYSIGIAASILGVCVKILRRWDKSNKTSCVRTVGGHRRFPFQEIKRILSEKQYESVTQLCEKRNKCAIYGRVSSHKQKKRGDLERQVEAVKKYCESNNLKVVKVYKDLGSGLNSNRKGLWRLVRDAKKGKFSSVAINYKDRLTRFGYKYLEEYLSEFGIDVVCVNSLEYKTPESELVEDLVGIIQSFSGKLYGMRSHKSCTN